MAVRVRRNGKIVCAAYSIANEGDVYLDDGFTHYLAGCIDPEIHILQNVGFDEEGEEVKKIDLQALVDYYDSEIERFEQLRLAIFVLQNVNFLKSLAEDLGHKKNNDKKGW